VRLRQLLWVRCKNIEQALRAADLLIQGGGFGLIALDLSDVATRVVRQVQLNVWFRFRRAVEGTATVLLLLGEESHAKTCASLVLRMEGEAGDWPETAQETGAAEKDLREKYGRKNSGHAAGCLLGGVKSWAEVVRSRMQSGDGRTKAGRALANRVLSIDARRMDEKRMDAAEFAIRTEWNYFQRR